MLNTILSILIKEILELVIEAGSNYISYLKLEKENKKKAKEILSEKDPKVRATRVKDFLNS